MRDFRVALAQTAPILGDPAANLDHHLQLAQEAATQQADWVVFPELSLTGYHLLDQVPEVAVRTDSPILERLAEASAEIDIVAGFVEESIDYKFYNSMVWLRKGAVHHVQRKLYLPTYGMFQEGREFARGERLRSIDTPEASTGVLICEDLWHPSNAWLLAQEGVEVIVGPSNSPTRGAKPDRGITSLGVWQELLQVTAQFQTAFVVYVNRVGGEDGVTFGGGSFVIDPFGRVVDEMPALEEELRIVELKSEVLRRARSAYPLLRDERLDLVQRELDRILRERYDLPDPVDTDS